MGFDPIRIIGVSQDANPYSYAWNSPLNVIDPSGWDEVCDPLCPVIFVGGDRESGGIPNVAIHDERRARAGEAGPGSRDGGGRSGARQPQNAPDSFGQKYQQCMQDRLGDLASYASTLATLGAAYGIGSTPVMVMGAGTAALAKVGGAWAGGYVGGYVSVLLGLSVEAGVATGVTAGLTVGTGVLAGVGIAGMALSGYAIGSAAYCSYSASL